MSTKVKIDGEVFEISEEEKKVMKFFDNAEAIEKSKTGEPVMPFVIFRSKSEPSARISLGMSERPVKLSTASSR